MTAQTVLRAFAEDEDLGRVLARQLGVRFGLLRTHVFPEGETRVTAPPAAETVLLLRRLHQPEPKLMPLLLAADALRRRGARRLVLAAPYLPYMRQDRLFHAGEALSRDVFGALVGERFERIVTVQAHLHRTRDLAAVFAPARIDNLSAAPLLACLGGWTKDVVVIAPDHEASPWAREFAEALGAPWTYCNKQRTGDREVTLALRHPERVQDRSAVLIDDIASTGVTLIHAAGAVLAAGAASVDVAVVHAFLSPEAEASLRAAGVRRILSTDSLPHPTNVVSLAELLSAALRNEIHP